MLKTNDYNFMRNDYGLITPIQIGGLQFDTVDHAYQSLKATDPKVKEAIASAFSPREARRLGKNLDLPADWDSKRYVIMETLVEAKFRANPQLAQLLIDTGDEPLEMHHDTDSYWGCVEDDYGTVTGENNLGKILVRVRDKLKITASLLFVEPEPEEKLINLIKKIIPEEGLSSELDRLFGSISTVITEANLVWSAQCASLDKLKESVKELQNSLEASLDEIEKTANS